MAVQFTLNVEQKSQEKNRWISSVFTLGDYLLLCLGNKIFQIEMLSDKIKKSFQFDLSTIHQTAVQREFLVLTDVRSRVLVCTISDSRDSPDFQEQTSCLVPGRIDGVRFLENKGELKFAVFCDQDLMVLFKLSLRVRFDKSEVAI